MIALLILDFLERNEMTNIEFADQIGFSTKTVGRWTKQGQVPTHFSAKCILDMLLKEIASPRDKERFAKTYWWIWKTEYQWRLVKMRLTRIGRKRQAEK